MLSFEGRVAIVTGAGRGIGGAHARLLAARGAAVVVNDVGFATMGGGDRSRLPASRMVEEIVAAGGQAIANFDDISTRGGARALAADAIEAFGGVDILINNAGINQLVPFPELTPDDFDKMMKVHAYGSFHVAQAVWPHMVERGYGRIVLTTSGAAFFGLAPTAHYCAAKGAVFGMVRSLAVEGAPRGIACNGLNPSAYTRMAGDDLELKARMERSMPAELVAPVAAWLAHESCPLNGEILHGGAGRASRVFVGETVGFTSPTLSLEDVARHSEQVMDEAGYYVFEDAIESSVVLARLAAEAR